LRKLAERAPVIDPWERVAAMQAEGELRHPDYRTDAMRVENFAIELVRGKEAGKTSGSFAEELFEAYAHSLLPDSAKDECRLSCQLLTLPTSLRFKR
jgi:hypothetical protein